MNGYKHTFYGELSAFQAAAKGYLPAIVLVNGQEVKGCILFNDLEGWADVWDRKSKFPEVDSEGRIKIERIFGDIVYLPKPYKIRTSPR